MPLDAEFVQIPIFPRWLLVVLAALLALLLAWFTLVRPAVRSAAREAATEAVRPRPTPAGEQGAARQDFRAPAPAPAPAQARARVRTPPPAARGRRTVRIGRRHLGRRRHLDRRWPAELETIDVQTSGGETKTGTYRVPEGSVFGVTASLSPISRVMKDC
ncbi:hypothetical protein SGLAM104S_04010 [Streptomyces glaucescens]